MSRPVCPICEKSAPAAEFRPFCSRRCADVDLQRWFSGRYVIPAAEAETPAPERDAEDED